MADRERLTKTLHAVETAAALQLDGEDLRETYDQSYWALKQKGGCGTAMCIAGWACYLEGDTFLFDIETYSGTNADRVLTADGRRVEIPVRAAELLGIDDWQAENLFKACNTLETVRRLVGEFLGE